MNLVGKIFIVLIFVMSLVFMSLSLMVYSTHKNWRDVVENPQKTTDKDLGLKFQLDAVQNEKKQLEDEKTKLQADLDNEKATRRQALAKLETENEQLRHDNEQLTKDQEKVTADERQAVAALQATQDVAKGIRTQVEGLRKDAEAAREERDATMKKFVEQTDELHQAVNELKRLKDRGMELTESLAKARQALRVNNLDENKDFSGKPPATISGTVVAIRAGDLVEVNVGSDDGLLKGHRLMVYRADGFYLGDIEVIEVQPHNAVCRIDPNYRRGAIQEGDRIAAKKL
jgi:small-conductance mechanosensitive channel